ncbi:MAG: hypothetical protein JSS76_11670 [Bacteroidetes bacterium]|nr:hypothetical protein [Bacteroidota bacterium]
MKSQETEVKTTTATRHCSNPKCTCANCQCGDHCKCGIDGKGCACEDKCKCEPECKC